MRTSREPDWGVSMEKGRNVPWGRAERCSPKNGEKSRQRLHRGEVREIKEQGESPGNFSGTKFLPWVRDQLHFPKDITEKGSGEWKGIKPNTAAGIAVQVQNWTGNSCPCLPALLSGAISSPLVKDMDWLMKIQLCLGMSCPILELPEDSGRGISKGSSTAGMGFSWFRCLDTFKNPPEILFCFLSFPKCSVKNQTLNYLPKKITALVSKHRTKYRSLNFSAWNPRFPFCYLELSSRMLLVVGKKAE